MNDVVVRRRYLEPNRNAGGRAHRVDRDHSVRVLVLPVELAADDPNLEALALRSGGRNIRDSRELDEDERSDEEEDDDRADRPH